MITVMRKHHKVLMIIITVLVCISFSWYWNKTDFAQMGDATVGKLYDRDVSQVEYQRNARLLRLASQLGMRDMVQDLTLGAQNENEAFERFSWNLMVMRHEADQLGIKPTTAEIAATVKSLPAFKGEKGFDLTAYTQFADHVLGSLGFSEAQIEELAGDQIRLDRVKKLLSAGVAIPEAEMRKGYEEAYAKMDVSVVRFRFDDFTKDVQPSDDEIAKYFEAQKDQLKTDEKRKVKVVEFNLTEEQKKLTGKPRIDVLQKLADQANDFTDALQAAGGDFDKASAKFNLKPKETGDFTQAAPDPLLAGTPTLVQAAFSLMKEAPNSEAVQTTDGFMVEHLVNIEPARPLTPEEARPKIVESLKKQGVRTMVAAKATEAAQKMRDAIQSGKTAEAAAAEAGLKAEKLPAFALVDTPPGETPAPKPDAKAEAPDIPYIKQAASKLEPKSVSDYVGTPQGGLLVVVEKRETLGPAEFEKARGALEKQALGSKSQVVFYEWLREQRRAAGVQEKAPTASG
ncbi:MAG: peptidylprolyl isomerase [Chthoniobacterales bacterium]|nr:peptidylprolyl isomerase [Chthoniobacterales bacterium]